MSKILIPKLERIKALGKQIPKWTDETSIYFKLPEHYKARQRDFLNTLPKPVHYKLPKTKYQVDHEHGVKTQLQSLPLPVLYPTQSKLGLWGGEGILPGMKKPKQKGFKRPEYLSTKLWRPRIMKMIFYTEILDKYYALTCTRHTLELIEEAKGFDNYILKTHEVDLKSDIGMQLKREMLIKLAHRDFISGGEDTLSKRYASFAIPLEEAEWVGLKPWEAMVKLKKSEHEKMLQGIRPLKEAFAEEVIDQLDKGELVEETKPEEKKNIIRKMYEENFK